MNIYFLCAISIKHTIQPDLLKHSYLTDACFKYLLLDLRMILMIKVTNKSDFCLSLDVLICISKKRWTVGFQIMLKSVLIV